MCMCINMHNFPIVCQENDSFVQAERDAKVLKVSMYVTRNITNFTLMLSKRYNISCNTTLNKDLHVESITSCLFQNDVKA